MPLVVEDGTALPGADSYAAVDFIAAYLTDRGLPAFADGDPEDQEAAARRGTRYVDLLYRDRWPGRRVAGRAQGLDWPREDVVDSRGYAVPSDEVPVEVRQAAAEATHREFTRPGSLMPDPSRLKSAVTIGPISVQYAETSAGPVPVVEVIEGLLWNVLLSSRAGVKWLKRA